MPRYKAPRIIGGILKLIVTALIALVVGTIIWRVFFSAKIPSEVKYLQKNEILSAAYAETGGNLTFRRQEQASITRAEKNYGYFSVVDCVFIPEAAQVQLVFRYNNSTIRHLAEDYGLEEVPSKSEDLFDVTLIRTTDLTPENTGDNGDPSTLKKDRVHATSAVRAETQLYTFYRYVFDGVTVEDVTDGVFADVYWLGDINYNADAYGTLCLYASGDEWLDRPLSSGDRKAFQ